MTKSEAALRHPLCPWYSLYLHPRNGVTDESLHRGIERGDENDKTSQFPNGYCALMVGDTPLRGS